MKRNRDDPIGSVMFILGKIKNSRARPIPGRLQMWSFPVPAESDCLEPSQALQYAWCELHGTSTSIKRLFIYLCVTPIYLAAVFHYLLEMSLSHYFLRVKKSFSASCLDWLPGKLSFLPGRVPPFSLNVSIQVWILLQCWRPLHYIYHLPREGVIAVK
jgi:hypothetical protein